MKFVLSLVLGLVLLLSACMPQTPASNPSSNTSTTPSSETFNPPPSNVLIPHNDDIVNFGGGFGINYNANIHSSFTPPWPAIVNNSTSIQAFNGTVNITYRGYIETLAGETRNDIIYIDATSASALPDPTQIGFNFTGLPAGITTVAGSGSYGGIHSENYRLSKTNVAITIPADVKPGVYNYSIDVNYQGTQFGTIHGVIKVLSAETEPWGAVYLPGQYLYVWGRLLLPETDGEILGSNLAIGYGLSQWWPNTTAAANDEIWAANITLGENSTPSRLDDGQYTVIILAPDQINIVGYVNFIIQSQ